MRKLTNQGEAVFTEIALRILNNPAAFDIEHWFSTTVGVKSLTAFDPYHECGTTGCIWGLTMLYLQEIGIVDLSGLQVVDSTGKLATRLDSNLSTGRLYGLQEDRAIDYLFESHIGTVACIDVFFDSRWPKGLIQYLNVVDSSREEHARAAFTMIHLWMVESRFEMPPTDSLARCPIFTALERRYDDWGRIVDEVVQLLNNGRDISKEMLDKLIELR